MSRLIKCKRCEAPTAHWLHLPAANVANVAVNIAVNCQQLYKADSRGPYEGNNCVYVAFFVAVVVGDAILASTTSTRKLR